MRSREASLLGGSKGAGTDPLGQHDEASAESSAGRQAVPHQRTTQNESIDGIPRVQPKGTDANELSKRDRGGDRRIASRQARESRVTIRLSSGEADQLARVADRFGLSESGAIRAAIDYLDGAPPPKVIDRDVLRSIAAVNAIGVNVNQLTRQGWSGVEPELDELRDATAQLLAIAKEMSS